MKIKKIIAVAMAVVMLVSGLSLSAFASVAEPKTFNYVALGDSIASGFGLTSTAADLMNDKALVITDELLADPVSEAYAAVFGEYLERLGSFKGYKTKTTNLAATAYRAQDVAAAIRDASYKGYAAEWILEDFVAPGASDQLLKYHDYFNEYLSEADLVSVQLGGNDILMSALLPIFFDEKYVDNPILNALGYGVILTLFGCTSAECVGAALMVLDQMKDDLSLDDFIEAAEYLNEVSENMDAIVEDSAANVKDVIDAVHELNDEAEVVVIGMFNPYGNSLVYEGEVKDICAVTTNIFQEAAAIYASDETVVEPTGPASSEILGLVALLGTITGKEISISDYLDADAEQLLYAVADEVAYPLQYALIGENVAPQLAYLNNQLTAIAEETDSYFASVYDISNECNLDPHPTAEGHREIASLLGAYMHNVILSIMCGRPVDEKVYIYGDVDLDQKVTIVDATMIQRCLAGLDSCSLLQSYLSDADGDGYVSIIDATMIQRHLASIANGGRVNQSMSFEWLKPGVDA
jgi:lysophospholipase L1-like esterase